MPWVSARPSNGVTAVGALLKNHLKWQNLEHVKNTFKLAQYSKITKCQVIMGNFVEMTIQLPEKCLLNSGRAATPLAHYWSGQLWPPKNCSRKFIICCSKVIIELTITILGEWHKQAQALFLTKNVKDMSTKQIIEIRRLISKQDQEIIVKRLNVYPFRYLARFPNISGMDNTESFPWSFWDQQVPLRWKISWKLYLLRVEGCFQKWHATVTPSLQRDHCQKTLGSFTVLMRTINSGITTFVWWR